MTTTHGTSAVQLDEQHSTPPGMSVIKSKAPTTGDECKLRYVEFDFALATEIGQNDAIVLMLMNRLIQNARERKGGSSILRDGRYWTYQSVRKLREQYLTFMSTNTIRRVLERLTTGLDAHGEPLRLADGSERGPLLVTGDYNKRGFDNTTWYALHTENIKRLQSVAIVIQPPAGNPTTDEKTRSPKMGEPFAQNGQAAYPKWATQYQRITPEHNSEHNPTSNNTKNEKKLPLPDAPEEAKSDGDGDGDFPLFSVEFPIAYAEVQRLWRYNHYRNADKAHTYTLDNLKRIQDVIRDVGNAPDDAGTASAANEFSQWWLSKMRAKYDQTGLPHGEQLTDALCEYVDYRRAVRAERAAMERHTVQGDTPPPQPQRNVQREKAQREMDHACARIRNGYRVGQDMSVLYETVQDMLRADDKLQANIPDEIHIHMRRRVADADRLVATRIAEHRNMMRDIDEIPF